MAALRRPPRSMGAPGMWAPPRRSGCGPPAAPPALPPLGLLLQLGVPRHRALKALAATGNKSVQLASDWLLTHVNDSTLDGDSPREYILYACPTGKFSEQLANFWNKSKEVCGWNGAHNFTPHITLVSFFKAPDECSLQLGKVLKQVIDAVGEPPANFLHLEPYISPNFMGLFVSDEHAEYFKNVAVQYVKQVSSTTICLEPHVKSLHVTLAYQFGSNMYSTLKNLAEDLQPLEKASWEIRLYSRDPRLGTHQVHKVKHVYASRESDELELRLGDYMYVEENVIKNSPDGWVQGVSWLTGMTGYLPINYTERTAESDAWTLHKSLLLGKHNETEKNIPSMASSDESLCNTNNKIEAGSVETDTDDQNKATEQEMNEWKLKASYMTLDGECFLNDSVNDKESNDETLTPASEAGSNASNLVSNENCQKGISREVLVMRHGERVDFTFGSWVPYCFDDQDNYIRKDMNMPPSLPKRSGGKLSFMVDCPLTMLGLLQARLVGEGLKMSGVTLTHVYASPSYRCIQTAQSMLDGLEAPKSVKIRVEPCLFEWLIWYSKGPPTFMTNDEFIAANFNIDTSYESFMNLGEPPFIQTEEDSACLEDCEQFYDRNAKFVEHVLKNTESVGGTIMLVGHASTLDTAWRGVSGLGARDPTSLGQLMRGVPYCSLASIKGPPWHLAPPPCPPMMNTSNKRYDWKVLRQTE